MGSTPVSAAGPRQATVILTALNISCEACAARIKTGLKKKFGKHIISVSTLSTRCSLSAYVTLSPCIPSAGLFIMFCVQAVS